ncbi:MAG: tautomerase family protein [Firmicutes bacterium]|nr:tautomerase family protein [Bacillota bacterium]
MSLGIINIVEGYTKEQKQLLIQETKKACMEGFGVSMDHSFVSIQEIKAENCDEQTKHMQCLYIFTTFGKTQEGKNLICAGFERACTMALGEDHGRSIVIFKEHGNENAGSAGYLRPFNPAYADYLKKQKEMEERNAAKAEELRKA